MVRPRFTPSRRTSGESSRPFPADSLPAVLLTGFEPFGGADINPSWLVAAALDKRRIAKHRVVAAQLPTVFGASLHELSRLLNLHRPALVICLGQAGGRSAISLERVAINVDDARISDNAGAQPIDDPVVADAPAAYFTGLPIKAMLQALQKAGVAGEVSQSAGTFVCNHVFYGLMHTLATNPALDNTRGGFMHLPYLSGQGLPAMQLDDMVRGLRAAVACALRTRADAIVAAGETH